MIVTMFSHALVYLLQEGAPQGVFSPIKVNQLMGIDQQTVHLEASPCSTGGPTTGKGY